MFRRIKNIQSSDYIGDSLLDINENFVGLDKHITSILSTKDNLVLESNKLQNIVDEFSNFFNAQYFLSNFQARLSTHPLQPVTDVTTDAVYQKNIKKIYLHRYGGDSICLFDQVINKWTRVIVPYTTEIPLSNYTLEDNTTYNIFIDYSSGSMSFLFKQFDIKNNLPLYDGVYVDDVSLKNRYIGTIHILYNQSTELSFHNDSNNGAPAKQLLWNMYNRCSSTIFCREKLSYSLKRTLIYKNNILPVLKDKPYFWNKTNELNTYSSNANNIIFVNGQKSLVEMQYHNTVQCNDRNAYIGIGLNEEFDPDFYNETSSNVSHCKSNDSVNMTSFFQKNVERGLNKITTFDAGDGEVIFNIDSNCNSVLTIQN